MDWLYIVAALAVVLVAMFIWLMFFCGGGTVEMMGRHTDLRPTSRRNSASGGGLRSSGAEVITDLDIYRAANLLINRHGANALIEAARMIDRALDHGDVEGRFIYKGEGGIRVEPATAPRSPRPHDV